MDRVIQFLRRSRWARRTLSASSVLLMIVAVGLLGFPIYTNVRHDRLQHHLSDQLGSPTLVQQYKSRSLRQGDALTRIEIPDLGVDTVVVQGTGASALRAGAGHYVDTPLPCEDGNVAIAGHRTTYGKPFANLDQLKPGSQIKLTTPIGQCIYEVMPTPRSVEGMPAAFVVLPTDSSVIANSPGKPTLTLTSCHPKHSAAKRIVIQAKLVKGLQGSA